MKLELLVKMEHWQNRISQIIKDRINTGKAVKLEEYKEMSLNSFEREALIHLMDDETLCYCCEIILKHTKHKEPYNPCTTYDEALQLRFIPELLNRCKNKLRS